HEGGIMHRVLTGAALVAAALFSTIASAQQPARAPFVASPEVNADRSVAFRIYAPKAENVRVIGSHIPGIMMGQMKKGDNGVWELVTGPINPGAYRYNFNVDGVSVLDYRNPAMSESNENSWNVFYVPGSGFMDTREVPHGSVEAVTYF